MIVKYFSPLFFLAYLLIAFVWPTVRTWRQTGINPVTFGNSDSTHDYVGKIFKLFLALIPVVIIAYFFKQFYPYLLPAGYLNSSTVQCVGIALCLLSCFWTVIAQIQMGNSWRIGIDNNKSTDLIVSGLFKVSRNPIFLGMIFTLIGFFLMLPNAVTLLVMVTGYFLIQIQIRLEEEFLLKHHGRKYEEYKLQTRRLI